MATVSPLSGSNFPIQVGTTLNIGVRPAATGSSETPSSATLTAQQGADAVTKGLGKSSAIYAELSSLQYKIRQAGSAPDEATAKALTAEIAATAKKIDTLAADAKTGSANLLSGSPSTVSVATGSGVRVNIAAQALDSKALGLDKLSVTDSDSLRAATGAVARALGQTQLTVFRLQTADGAVGISPAATNPGITAYDKALGNQSAGASANSASAAVEKALSAQISANAASYTSTGLGVSDTTTVSSIFSLFT